MSVIDVLGPLVAWILCLCVSIWSFIRPFLWHISPALSTVILGGLLVNRFFVRKANLANLVDRTCGRLDQLRELNAKYWTTNYAKRRARESDELEARIKAEISAINCLLEVLLDKYGIDTKREAMRLILECTGGAFESKQRKANKEQFLKVANAINQLTLALQKQKL